MCVLAVDLCTALFLCTRVCTLVCVCVCTYVVLCVHAYAVRVRVRMRVRACVRACARHWQLSSLVTLFSLMSVNNWPIIMEGCVAATNSGARLYFIAFYGVAVVLVLNVLVRPMCIPSAGFGASAGRRISLLALCCLCPFPPPPPP